MKALVTGGAGFIGSHLVERLLGQGHEVRVVDDFSTGKRANLEPLKAGGGGSHGARLEVVEADIRSAWALRDLAAGCDVIFHEAAIVSVPYSVENPQETHDVNLQGTLNVLEAARHAKTRRLVFASSAAIYGEAPGLPKQETMLPAPVSPYGLEKLTSEHYLAISLGSTASRPCRSATSTSSAPGRTLPLHTRGSSASSRTARAAASR